MDDLQYGSRNKRGDWAPSQHLALAPFWSWPPRLGQVLGWCVGYLWPWNLVTIATAALWWNFVLPDTGTLRTLAWGWPLKLFAANWLGKAFLLGVITLFLWHAAHRLRVTLHDFGLRQDAVVAAVVYLGAALGTGLSILYLLRI